MPASRTASPKAGQPLFENAFTSDAWPLSVTNSPPAPTANGNSSKRVVWATAGEDRTTRRATRAGARAILSVMDFEDTSGAGGRKRSMLRIRRPARARLEFRIVPNAETSTAGSPAIAFFDPLLALLVPSRCAVCEAPRVDLGGGGVCRACWASLPVLDAASACPRCALPSGGCPCEGCRLAPPAVARTVAFGLYAGGLRPLHHAVQFAGWDLLAAPLGARLAALARATGITDGAHALVSVPSTWRRNRDRGYDPAMLLADETSRHLDTPRRALLSRRRDTPPQSSLQGAWLD